MHLHGALSSTGFSKGFIVKLISHGKIVAVLLTLVLSACGIAVEQPPGARVSPGVLLNGTWDTTIALKGAQRGTLAIKPEGEDLIVQWTGAGADGTTARAGMFQHMDKQYLALGQSAQAGGYFIVRIEDTSRERVRVRAIDRERAEQLLKEMKLPVVYRELWLHKELFIDKASFQALMERHPDELFAKGVLITLDKVR
jgi:hypothetical protein